MADTNIRSQGAKKGWVPGRCFSPALRTSAVQDGTQDADTTPAFLPLVSKAVPADRAREREDNRAEAEQIEKLCEQAYERGRADGEAAGRAEAVHEQDVLRDVLSQKLTAAFSRIVLERSQLRKQVAQHTLEMVEVLIRKVFKRTMRPALLEEITSCIRYTVSQMLEHQPLKITIHPDLAEDIEEMINDLRIHYDGDIRIIRSADVCPEGMSVTWNDGGSEWRMDRIETLMLGYLNDKRGTHE